MSPFLAAFARDEGDGAPEHSAVDEGDAEGPIGTTLDHVALVTIVTHVQCDRNAVAHRGRAARKLCHMANEFADIGSNASCLGVLNVTRECIDYFARQLGAIW
jgi:hypothetical protein